MWVHQTLQVHSSSLSPAASPRLKLLFFMPGVGCKDKSRLSNVKKSVRHVLSFRKHLDIDCLVQSFVERKAWDRYKPSFLPWAEKRCKVHFLPGTMYADHAKSLHPMLLERAGYDFLLFSLDDVTIVKSGDFPGLDLLAATRVSKQFSLDIGSPRVEGAHWPPVKYMPGLYPPLELKNTSGMLVEWVEHFSTLFTPRGWTCYWDAVDNVRLANGYVSAQLVRHCLKRFEGFRVGVYAHQVVRHGANMNERCQGAVETYVPKGFRPRLDKGYYNAMGRARRLNRSLGYF